MKVLNVAEKNSVARAVTEILSRGRSQQLQSCATWCKVYSFPFQLANEPVDMVFTSGEQEKILRNLQTQARSCQQLVLWLDCDREGENIAFEVIQVSLVASDIMRAVNSLGPPNERDAMAVDARQEIDLRIGAAFTRLQTLLLQNKFDWSGLLPAGRERMLLSYGPCQFPTLGLIVQRLWEIRTHIPEDFWSIEAKAAPTGDQPGCTFAWSRGRLFDQPAAAMLHELCCDHPTATVAEVKGQQKQRWAPTPLSTLEMQKRASQYLRMPGERIMRYAEELYQAGAISYPRTETDIFDKQYDLRALIGVQAGTRVPWAPFAQKLVEGPLFRWPRSGGHNDQAHPPIHPTAPFQADGSDKARLYEFICRHFLACCSLDAEGQSTTVTIDIAGEGFCASGLVVTARNFLDVYPYQKWGTPHETLPQYVEGQTFEPASIDLKPGCTQAPPRLTEADLIAKMEQHGIGTDATVADHIQKQLERGYAVKDEAGQSQTFSPTPLGEALISAYSAMGLTNLWQPQLRGAIEGNILAVAQGARTKASRESVLAEAILAFQTDFGSAMAQAHVLEAEVREVVFGSVARGAGAGAGARRLDAGERQGEPGGPGLAPGSQAFGGCSCGGQLVLSRDPGGGPPHIACSAWPLHRFRVDLPRITTSVGVSEEACAACGASLLDLGFTRALLPPGFQPRMHTCVACDPEFQRLIQLVGAVRRGARPGASPGTPRGWRAGGERPRPGRAFQPRAAREGRQLP
ncbi:DNA topoisomerase 3-alpha [Auxenochlorella protothecoides]|uniref:DNA topoisomerase n=1 Tax=Auxenochlorella protothecoides TaxID=3075 RepID=A0A087SIH9_AUXPR|nr:DNA topoisomerase 3-alpha [Auxenochlorella protothecoides]KFM25533.1 DNA topoisomerase 3-alpha [Auxenochlorella protothecoides]